MCFIKITMAVKGNKNKQNSSFCATMTSPSPYTKFEKTMGHKYL